MHICASDKHEKVVPVKAYPVRTILPRLTATLPPSTESQLFVHFSLTGMTWDNRFFDTYRLRRVDLENFLRKLFPNNNNFDVTNEIDELASKRQEDYE
ncbi:hypothetical protein J1614_006385 [Plenodomus biglobosus]|nr:hypothetical protein J1614_006385 [Plenodomus biglobosus]